MEVMGKMKGHVEGKGQADKLLGASDELGENKDPKWTIFSKRFPWSFHSLSQLTPCKRPNEIKHLHQGGKLMEVRVGQRGED